MMTDARKPHGRNSVVNLPLSSLKFPPAKFSPREIAGINQEEVERLLPIEAWERKPGEYWILSDPDVYQAALELGIKVVPCVVRGDMSEWKFLLEAFGADLRRRYGYRPKE